MTETKVAIGYDPQPKQYAAHRCPADELLYGGSAGGGKSEWLLNDGIITCVTEPGARVPLFRRTYKELDEFISRSKVLIPPEIASYNEKHMHWTFKNAAPGREPSVLTFHHLQHADDVYAHQGAEYDKLLFDEMTHFLPRQINYMRSRNRSSLPNPWARIRGASNPGNVGHKFLRDHFVKPLEQDVNLVAYNILKDDPDFDVLADRSAGWRKYPPGTRGKPEPWIVWRPDPTEEQERLGLRDRVRTRCFIPASVDDNKYISDDYKTNLTMLPEAQKQALLYGNWDSFEGQFFSSFSEETHVIDPISPPSHWRKWRAIDWGYRDPLCCLWLTQNPETNQIIVYRELYQVELTDSEAKRLITAMTPDSEHIDFTLADPSMWRGDSNDNALSKAMIYNQQPNQVHLLPGTNDRITGWAHIQTLLALNPEHQQPGLVFTRNCENLIYTLPTLVHSENRPEDVDDDGEDHASDALRYAVMSRATIGHRRRKPIKAGAFRRY